MKINHFHCLILVFVFSAIAVNVIAADKLHSEISAATAEWVKLYNAGNVAGVTELYADDAKVMPPNSDFVTGKQGITAVFQGMLDSGAKAVTLTPVEVMRKNRMMWIILSCRCRIAILR